MSAPKKCPLCGETIGWIQIDKQKKGFSLGKSVAGGVIFGPLGLIAGTGGKKWLHITVKLVDLNTNTKNKNRYTEY